MWGEFRRFRGFDNYCGPPIDRADQGTIIALPDRGYFKNSSHLSPVFESPFFSTTPSDVASCQL